jgi:hypothetical protein
MVRARARVCVVVYRIVPAGMVIQGLRDRLVKIVADYGLQCRLRQGCNQVCGVVCVIVVRNRDRAHAQILKADCVALFQRLYRGQTIGFAIDPKSSRVRDACCVYACVDALRTCAQCAVCSVAVESVMAPTAAGAPTTASRAADDDDKAASASASTVAAGGAAGVGDGKAKEAVNEVIAFWCVQCGLVTSLMCVRVWA